MSRFLTSPSRLLASLTTILVFSTPILYIQCGPKPAADKGFDASHPLLELLSPEQTGISFANSIVENADNNVLNNINIYNGGGVAVGDVNGDNLPDIYFACSNGPNKLYLNKGNFQFQDVTESAGIASESGFDTGVGMADVNADGLLDIFVCRAGPPSADRVSKLFINKGGNPPVFEESAAKFGLIDSSACTGVNFFDYDLDGDLDCYFLNHPDNLAASNELLLKFNASGDIVADLNPVKRNDSDRLYRNDGATAGTPVFKDVSAEAGIRNFGFGLSVSVSDLNLDGRPDIFVANDFLQPDNCYINNGKGGFEDRVKTLFKHGSVFSMGTDLSDFDNDGLVDLIAMDMLPEKNFHQKRSKTTNPLSRYLSIVQSGIHEPVTRNVLQRNNGNGTFSDIACLAGIYKTDWAWTSLLADFDNDGLKDLYIANGYKRDVNDRDIHEFVLPEFRSAIKTDKKTALDVIQRIPEFKTPNFIFQNAGNWQFIDKRGDWMSIPLSWSCGGAWGDLDADGDLDLVVNNLEAPAFVYKNLAREQKKGAWLQAKLKGSAANPFAVGASVRIEYQGKVQYQELNPVRGIFSSSEHLIHFGLGEAGNIDKLSVRWPDGKVQILTNIPVNQRINLDYSQAQGYVATLYTPAAAVPFFKDISSGTGVEFEHMENTFVDFESWPLNIWSTTDYGPLTAQADVNGDGLEDFFIGNSFDRQSALFVQKPGNRFESVSKSVFSEYKNYEDHGALFFDADGDGDQDLFITSGGPDADNPLAWQVRLLINDGKGNFANETTSRLPVLKDLCLRATAFDYDRDGDLDVFAGGRVTPKNWPLTPRSIVLRNDGGKFSDVTASVGGDFAKCGMVTDLSWKDVDGDGQNELIVVGEWMPVSLFKLENNQLRNKTEQYGLAASKGIWHRLAFADLDADGDMDLITGNLGLNTRFTASEKAPFRCYAKDFDNNGTLDPMTTFMEDGKEYPLLQKEVYTKHMPVLKKKFLYTKDFASATIDQVWPQKALDEAEKFECYELASCWWENRKGQFVKHLLPVQAQVSVVQGILAQDFNRDGHIDLLLAGNKYGFEVETNRCDAGNGAFFAGDGKGNFTFVENYLTGFWAQREARDLAMLKTASGQSVIVVSNNHSRPQLYLF